MLQHASNLGPSRVRWQHSPQICKTVRDYESVWYGKMIIAQWSLQVCFASKSHWVTVHKRLVQCLGKPFGGVVPVFGLALHRGIQVKFQKSLGGKGNFAGGSQQRRQNKSPHVAGENINLRFMFFIFSPLGSLEWSRSWHVWVQDDMLVLGTSNVRLLREV